MFCFVTLLFLNLYFIKWIGNLNNNIKFLKDRISKLEEKH